jgi:hypothetical protein
VSRRRRILLVSFVALALLVACAPLLARTGAARRFVASRLSDALGRPVEIEGIDAGWMSGVTVRGLVVRGAAAEFRETPLMEAASVTLEDPLPGLVLSGASRIAIDGLKVRVEEQAGGRTNVDDLVRGLAKPRPMAPKREARPFRLTLTDASIRVQRLLPRPQPRRIDPFREDPVILDAADGLVVVGIEEMDLRLDATPGETTLDLSAALDIAGRPGRAEVAVRLGPRGPSGRVRVEGIDLSLLDPFVKGLEGRVELRAEGSPAGADVKLRAEGLKAGRVDEAWAELTGRIRRDGDAVAFDALSLRTASGAFSLDGRGAWPPRGIEIRAQASTEALGIDLKGPLRLDVSGEGSDLAGTLTTPDLDARFDVAVREGAVEIRKLDAKAFESDISVQGELGGVPRLSGRADVNLNDLRPFLPEGASLEGRLRVPAFELLDRSLKADADVAAFRARGFFAEDVEIDRGELHVDAALSDDRDVLRVVRAQLDGLAAQGTLSGLRHGNLAADGTIQGTLALNPLHARLLGLREVRGLRGQVTIDAKAATGEKGTLASGTAVIDRFHVEDDRGAWDLARISAEGSYRDGGAILRATADGFVLDGSLAGGKGKVALDIEAIERQPLLVRLLPKDLALEGPVKLRADVESAPWRVAGTVESATLTAEFAGRGVLSEEIRLSFTAREAEPGWFVAVPEVVLENLGVKASVGEGFLGRDGSRGGRLHVEGPLDRLATLAPEAARFGPEGRLSVDVLAAHDGRWSFTGGAVASDASLLLSGKRTPPRTARLEFDAARPGDGTALLRRVHLTTKATDLEGTATLGPTLVLRMSGKTRLEEIAPYAPMFRGSGEVVFDEIAFDLDAEGRLSASASLAAESIRVQGGRLRKARVRSHAEGRLVKGALADVKTTLSVTAACAERGNILVEEFFLLEKGGGHSGEYSLGTHIEGGRVKVGATSWEQVRLDVRGRLDRLLGERPPTGVTGDIKFARWNLGPFLWEDARGKIAIEEGNVVVKDLVAGLHGGRVKAQGKLMPSGERLGWEASAEATGLVLTERIGRPLSFVIPFLRVQKEAGQLAGRADFDVKLSAADTTDAAILKTLAGAGTAHLHDIEAKNSILLPLLSFRLDKAILREPFRFKDLRVSFDVGDGSIRPAPFELEATPFGIRVKEIVVGLDGTVDALVVPGILPLRVRGTLDDPDVRPAPLAPFR